MNRKLDECNTCERWNNEKNKMRNSLWCKFNCQARQEHEYRIALAYNKSMSAEMESEE